MNYTALLQHYDQNGRKYARAERMWFATQPSLDAAINTAARALNSQGKRYHHQRRIRRAAIAKARVALFNAKQQIQACTTFDDLYNTVVVALRGIKWLGELYYYDTALRLGYHLHKHPTKVYIHAGTREGARALGLNYRARLLEISSLPKQLRHLPADEIEDFLCIYSRDVIRTICG